MPPPNPPAASLTIPQRACLPKVVRHRPDAGSAERPSSSVILSEGEPKRPSSRQTHPEPQSKDLALFSQHGAAPQLSSPQRKPSLPNQTTSLINHAPAQFYHRTPATPRPSLHPLDKPHSRAFINPVKAPIARLLPLLLLITLLTACKFPHPPPVPGPIQPPSPPNTQLRPTNP
jgi:hypothetical protein